MTTLVLVDDEVNILKALKRMLASEGWDIYAFDDPEQALASKDLVDVDLVISDYRMPQMNGVEFLRKFKQQHPEAIRLLLSGQTDIAGMMGAINTAEVYRFIMKPWNDEEIKITIKQALAFNHLLKENERLAQTVRRQSRLLRSQLSELKRLEAESPGITQVDWNDDGSINLMCDELDP